jgi:aryl-alcohol dehydrogenase-like predicted oxidoreductase
MLRKPAELYYWKFKKTLNAMHKRKLGKTELEFTTIGVGTWAIGGGNWKFGWGDQDEQQAIDGVLRAIDLGINWIDTAAVYGAGESEKLVGAALKKIPAHQRPLVATKCGRVTHPDKSIEARLTRASVISECEASLKNLDVDCIDLYQMHWPEPDEQIEEGWQACADLVQQGKVRCIGVSNHNVVQMKRLLPIHNIASLQPPYNMLNRQIESDILPFCGREQIGVVCYSPMGKGLLTGAFTKERAANLSEKDHRSRDPKFTSPQLEINLEFVEAIRPVAEQNNRPMAQLSIAWVLRRSEVTSAIVGVRNPKQIEETAGAANWKLTSAEITTIEDALTRRDEQLAELGIADQGRV